MPCNGAWRTLGRLAPDHLSSLRRVATIESLGSSTRIVGAKPSDREVERLLSNLEVKTFSSRDEREVPSPGLRLAFNISFLAPLAARGVIFLLGAPLDAPWPASRIQRIDRRARERSNGAFLL